MNYVIHICAPNDTNGNPRRCYAVYRHDGTLLAVVDEGYRGWTEALKPWPGFIELCRINVKAGEYRDWIATGKGLSR